MRLSRWEGVTMRDRNQDHNRTYALLYAKAGIPVFPCGADPTKDSFKKPLCKWRQDSTSDPAGVAELWERHPGAMPAIDMGKAGMVALDGDRHGGPDGVAALWQLLDRRPTGTAFRAHARLATASTCSSGRTASSWATPRAICQTGSTSEATGVTS